MVLENLEIEKEDKIVGSVFRIVEEKNPELWIDVAGEVITKMENTHFVIVGGGVQLDLMRDKGKEWAFQEECILWANQQMLHHG